MKISKVTDYAALMSSSAQHSVYKSFQSYEILFCVNVELEIRHSAQHQLSNSAQRSIDEYSQSYSIHFERMWN